MTKLGKIDMGAEGRGVKKDAQGFGLDTWVGSFFLNIRDVKFSFRQDVVRLSNGLLDIWA